MLVDVFSYITNAFAERAKARGSDLTKLRLEIYPPAISVLCLLGVSIYSTIDAIQTLFPPPCDNYEATCKCESASDECLDNVPSCAPDCVHKDDFLKSCGANINISHNTYKVFNNMTKVVPKFSCQEGESIDLLINVIYSCVNLFIDIVNTWLFTGEDAFENKADKEDTGAEIKSEVESDADSHSSFDEDGPADNSISIRTLVEDYQNKNHNLNIKADSIAALVVNFTIFVTVIPLLKGIKKKLRELRGMTGSMNIYQVLDNDDINIIDEDVLEKSENGTPLRFIETSSGVTLAIKLTAWISLSEMKKVSKFAFVENSGLADFIYCLPESSGYHRVSNLEGKKNDINQ
eukprot:UC4_evm3s1341